MRGSKAIQLIKGIFFILIVRGVSNAFDLTTVAEIFDTVLEWGFRAIMVIFQPELRRAREQLGRGSLLRSSSNTAGADYEKMREAIVKSIRYMTKMRIGALIVFEKETGL